MKTLVSLLLLLAIGLLVLAGFIFSGSGVPTKSTTTSASRTNSTISTTPLLCESSGGTGAYQIAQSVNYSGYQVAFIQAVMNHASVQLTSTQREIIYNELFSQRYFANATSLTSEFRFAKNQYFNNEMYGGNYDSSIWSYPTQIRIGAHGQLLIVFAQITNLYGSPYGNSTSRGTNQLTMFSQFGGKNYGFGEDSNMLPGTFAQDIARFDNGSQVINSEGLYVYGFQNDYSNNQTFYSGAPTYDHPYGSGPYDSLHSYDNKGFYFAGSLILGSPQRPFLTRYLFVVNMSRLSSPMGPSGCLKLGVDWNLFTTLPYGIHDNNTTIGLDFLPLNDDIPVHTSDSPQNPSYYLQLVVAKQE